jgi:hypothetical protein
MLWEWGEAWAVLCAEKFTTPTLPFVDATLTACCLMSKLERFSSAPHIVVVKIHRKSIQKEIKSRGAKAIGAVFVLLCVMIKINRRIDLDEVQSNRTPPQTFYVLWAGREFGNERMDEKSSLDAELAALSFIVFFVLQLIKKSIKRAVYADWNLFIRLWLFWLRVERREQKSE